MTAPGFTFLYVICVLLVGAQASCFVAYGSANIAISGRTLPIAGGQGAAYAWSSVQISISVSQTTSVSVNLTDTNNWFNVIVDGVVMSQAITTNGSQAPYSLVTGLDSATSHVVTFFKRTEAFVNPNATVFYGFILEGPSADSSGNCILAAASPPVYSKKIEFVGDSITCGYGDLGAYGCSFSPSTEDSYLAYGNLVASALDAQLYLEAWSGKGVVRNYGDPNTTSAVPFPSLYPYVVPTDTTTTPWSFSWVPDIVVINLGTNDYSTEPSPPQAVFESGYKAFIAYIRSKYSSNPNLQMFLACGPMIGDPCCQYVQNVVNASGSNIHYISLQNLVYNATAQLGCDGHPNTALQAVMANITYTAIQSVIASPSAATSFRPASVYSVVHSQAVSALEWLAGTVDKTWSANSWRNE
jgi:lysophospholipase L1-like esterase